MSRAWIIRRTYSENWDFLQKSAKGRERLRRGLHTYTRASEFCEWRARVAFVLGGNFLFVYVCSLVGGKYERGWQGVSSNAG